MFTLTFKRRYDVHYEYGKIYWTLDFPSESIQMSLVVKVQVKAFS